MCRPTIKVSGHMNFFFGWKSCVEKNRKIQLQHGLSVEIYGFDVVGMRIIRYLHASEVFIDRSRLFQFHCQRFFASFKILLWVVDGRRAGCVTKFNFNLKMK